MTQEEAEALATKREAHKGKSLRHKTWKAVHDPVKGWHAALVDNGRDIDGTARAMRINSGFDDDRPPDGPAYNLLRLAAAIEIFGLGPTLLAFHRIKEERGE